MRCFWATVLAFFCGFCLFLDVPCIAGSVTDLKPSAKILATNSYIFELTKKILCRNNSINLDILNGFSQDSHRFVVYPSHYKKIMDATHVFYLDSDFGRWIHKIKTNHNQKRFIDLYDGKFNEHVWNSPQATKKMVQKIFEIISTEFALSDLESSDLATCKNSLMAEIKFTEEEVKKIIYSTKSKNRTIVTYHNGLYDYAVDFGYTFISIADMLGDGENNFSPNKMQKVLHQLSQKNIKYLFLEGLPSDKVLKIFAKELGAKIAGVLDAEYPQNMQESNIFSFWIQNAKTIGQVFS